MNEIAAPRQHHPRWRIWTSDEGRQYATRACLAAPGTGVTVYAKTLKALGQAIEQAEANATRKSKHP